MIISDAPRESKLATPKPRTRSVDLAGQFLDLQRLHKKVRESERRMKGEFRPCNCRVRAAVAETKR
jgi:hypothetical protein